MANVNRNIVETRNLASKGRFGDTEIRDVRGEPSHVSALEAYYMDTAGIDPSASGKTINPDTKLPEYHGSMLGGGWGKTGGHPLHHLTMKSNPVADFLDWVLPTKKTDLFSSDTSEWDVGRQAGQVVGVGMEGLAQEQQQYMGPQGFLTREQELEETGITDVYGATQKAISGEEEQLIQKQNIAFSGETQKTISDLRKTAETKYAGQMKLSGLKGEKTEADYMSNLRKQMNQMMLDYQSAAGKPYEGGDALTQLNQLFSDYDEGGV